MTRLKTYWQGISWHGVSSGLSLLVQWVLMLVLARQVGAAEVGQLAMAFVVIRLISPLMDLGVTNTVIQGPAEDQDTWQSLFTLQVLLGVILFILTYLFGPWICDSVLGMRQSGNLLRIMSLVLLLSPWSLIHLAVFRKKLQFSRMGLVMSGAALLELLIGLWLLWLGWEIYALAWAFVSRFVVLLLGAWVSSPLHIKLQWRGLREERRRFALFDLGSQWVNQGSTQLDRLIIGGVMGPTSLGFYTLAWDLLIIPLSKIGGVLSQTALPIFSQLVEAGESLHHDYLRVARWTIGFSLPILVVLSWQPEWVVNFLYGPGWEPSAGILPILALAAWIKVLAYPGVPVIIARGDSRWLFFWNVWWTVILSAGMVWTTWSFSDLNAVGWFLAIISALVAPIWHGKVLREGKTPLWSWLKAMMAPAIFHALIIVLITLLTKGSGWPILYSIILYILMVFSISLVEVYWFRKVNGSSK